MGWFTWLVLPKRGIPVVSLMLALALLFLGRATVDLVYTLLDNQAMGALVVGALVAPCILAVFRLGAALAQRRRTRQLITLVGLKQSIVILLGLCLTLAVLGFVFPSFLAAMHVLQFGLCLLSGVWSSVVVREKAFNLVIPVGERWRGKGLLERSSRSRLLPRSLREALEGEWVTIHREAEQKARRLVVLPEESGTGLDDPRIRRWINAECWKVVTSTPIYWAMGKLLGVFSQRPG